MDIYLYSKFVKTLVMILCQLQISALTHRNDSIDFGRVFNEFIAYSETPVSTRSRSPKYQGK